VSWTAEYTESDANRPAEAAAAGEPLKPAVTYSPLRSVVTNSPHQQQLENSLGHGGFNYAGVALQLPIVSLRVF